MTGNGQPLILIADDDPDILALFSFDSSGRDTKSFRRGTARRPSRWRLPGDRISPLST